MILQLILAEAEKLPLVKVKRDIEKLLNSRKLKKTVGKIGCLYERREFIQSYCLDKIGPLTFEDLKIIEKYSTNNT